MVDTVKVTPYQIWPKAKFAKVEGGMKAKELVPIRRFFCTPVERITIRRDHYPNGIVLLNEAEMPNYATEEEIPVHFEDEDLFQTQIPRDDTWPTGIVVIFKPSGSTGGKSNLT